MSRIISICWGKPHGQQPKETAIRYCTCDCCVRSARTYLQHCYMFCLTGFNVNDRPFIHYLIAYSCCCCLRGHRSRTIAHESDAGKGFYYGVLLIIGHYLLMVRKGISPTSTSVVSAKTSDHVTTLMFERAFIHCLIAEVCMCKWFYQRGSALQTFAVSPLLCMSGIRQYPCIHSKRIVRTYDTPDYYPLTN